MDKIEPEKLKENITDFVLGKGADIVGFAPAERWDEAGEIPPDFRPRSLFPLTETVVVAGMGMPLPIVETTPSAAHMELYNTVNRELDGLAYQLTRYLGRIGVPAIAFPRDGYGSIKILKDKPYAAFSHVYAGKYAGLGTIGQNGVLLTPEFGPRVRLVSVLVGAKLPPSPLREEELCINCKTCSRCCPVGALTPRPDRIKADFVVQSCIARAEELTRRRCYPCGTCTKVCPVGQDRELYRTGRSVQKYLEEAATLQANPDAPQYKIWNHFRRWGSWSKEEMEKR